MAQIKFSHSYTKMPDKAFAENAFDKRTALLEVFRVKGIAELSKEFIAYDTEFFNVDECKTEHYPLPRGELLVLLLITYGQGSLECINFRNEIKGKMIYDEMDPTYTNFFKEQERKYGN